MAETFTGGQNDYVIEKAIFSTDRASSSNSYEISKLISDLEIYEHLDKPYLTGRVLFVDSHTLLNNIDFQGGEKLTITIKPLSGRSDIFSITKTFYTQKIISAENVNDTTQSVALYLVEDIAFMSSVQNINRSYTGTPRTIIDQISQKYVNREVVAAPGVYQSKMKVIVPNLHPVEAMMWVKSRATNTDGLPYFLYSVFADDKLRFKDLGSMLRAGPMNTKHPFLYWQSSSQTPTDSYQTIQSFSYNDIDDLLSLIRNGVVGAKYNFYDTMSGTYQTIDFDVDKDAFKGLVEKDYFDKNQKKYNYGPDYKVNEKRISEYNSVNISTISSSDVYKNVGNYKTLSQETDSYAYKKRVVGHALKSFMTKTPITIQLNGAPFIDGSSERAHLTTGNTVRVLVAESANDMGRPTKFDKKRSGDYIIYAARHIFTKERYDIKLLCTKLASYTEDPA